MYDKEKIYDSQIYPLMEKIIAVCEANDIGFVAQFLLKETEEGQLYSSSSFLPGEDSGVGLQSYIHLYTLDLVMSRGAGDILSTATDDWKGVVASEIPQ